MWIARSVAINNTHMVHSSVLHYITDMLSSENSRCLHCPCQTSVRGHNYRAIQRKDSEDCVINNSITISTQHKQSSECKYSTQCSPIFKVYSRIILQYILLSQLLQEHFEKEMQDNVTEKIFLSCINLYCGLSL